MEKEMKRKNKIENVWYMSDGLVVGCDVVMVVV